MKKSISLFLGLMLLFSVFAVSSLAAQGGSTEILYTSVLSSDKKTLKVTVSLTNALGLQAGDLNLQYDEDSYKFEKYTSSAPSGVTAVGGKAVTQPGLATCSFIVMDSVTKEMLDSAGNMTLCVFTFTSLKENPDADDISISFDAISKNDEKIDVKPVGKRKPEKIKSGGGADDKKAVENEKPANGKANGNANGNANGKANDKANSPANEKNNGGNTPGAAQGNKPTTKKTESPKKKILTAAAVIATMGIVGIIITVIGKKGSTVSDSEAKKEGDADGDNVQDKNDEKNEKKDS